MKKDLSNSVSTLLNAFSDFVKSGTTALKNYNDTIELEKKQYEERQKQLQFQQFASATENCLRKFIAKTLNKLGYFPHINPVAIQVKVTELCADNSFIAVAKISFTVVEYKAALYYEFDERFLNCAQNIRTDEVQHLDENLYQDVDAIRQKQMDESNRIYCKHFATPKDRQAADNEYQCIIASFCNTRFATYKSLYHSLSPYLYVVKSITHHKEEGCMELHLTMNYDDSGFSPANYFYLINSRL